jgi:putative PIG3 family NAD(P)H quinone oxidoreductase
MRAIFASQPGGPEVLEFREVPEPVPGDEQVVIEVHATALNRADLLQRRGHYPPPPGEPDSLGLECAGVIGSVGSKVTRFRPGDRVMALLGGGGYAERAVVHERVALPVPVGMSFTDAAAIPEAFLTAQEALFSVGELAPGETVLIHAAAGGVGSAAVQLAHLHGARVLATAGSDEKLALAKSLGADRVVNYRTENFAEVAEREDLRPALIVDFVGGSYWDKHARILLPGGRVVLLGLLGGRKAEVDFSRLLGLRQRIEGMVMRTRSVEEKIALSDSFASRFLASFPRLLRPIVDSVLDWKDVAKAHERMESNLNLGKIVLEVR